jgi:hypothetical protein
MVKILNFKEINDLLNILILSTFDVVHHFLNAKSVKVSLPKFQKPVPECRVGSQSQGCAIAQAVSCWLPTVAALVRSQVTWDL